MDDGNTFVNVQTEGNCFCILNVFVNDHDGQELFFPYNQVFYQ